jgi:SAM-dependent methyltransferase
MNLTRVNENRSAVDSDLRDSWMRKYFSPAMLGLYQVVAPALRAYAAGKLLDAGCGTMPFRMYLKPLVAEYHSLDIQKRVPEVEFVSDLENMQPVISEDYDVVLCTEALEHTPHPQIVIREIWRILRPHGKIILSVPYLSRLHEEPFDYYRFTEHGLRVLLSENGFSVLQLKTTGSLFSFIGHQISTFIVGSVWHLPIIKYLAFFLNSILCTLPCFFFDKLPFLATKFPLGYVVVAEKTSASQNPEIRRLRH